MSDTKIYIDSPQAATPEQVTAWRDVHGRIHLDEHTARYCSANDCLCRKCGKPTGEKYLMLCTGCSQLAERERYEKLPVVEWDGEMPLCVYNGDNYFWDEDSARDYVEEARAEGHEPMLCPCRPRPWHQLTADYWQDAGPDEWDGELPDELEAAVDALNAVIAKLPPASWEQDKKRIDVEKAFPREKAI